MSIGLIKTVPNRQILLDPDEPCMGEIRIDVRLTNGADEELAALGKLSNNDVRAVSVKAIVDTGAVRSVIPHAIFEQLGVRAFDQEVVKYADGRTETVDIVGPIRFHIFDRKTFDDAYLLGEDVLIGQTILEKLDLLADCKNGQLVPNPAHPDGPRHRV